MNYLLITDNPDNPYLYNSLFITTNPSLTSSQPAEKLPFQFVESEQPLR
jgi:hypothetical protein